jgi:deazaflavin-dependent oxidoreductase (nitroreductase family)
MPVKGEYQPSTANWVRDQVDRYERSGGTEGTTLRGMPVVILTSRGARSGKVRKTPLMRVEQDGRYALVASQGGAPVHPRWYFNLVADPHVELQDGPAKSDMLARQVTGGEKDVWWARAVAAYPDYAEYQRRTERQIPVFVLEPDSADPASD